MLCHLLIAKILYYVFVHLFLSENSWYPYYFLFEELWFQLIKQIADRGQSWRIPHEFLKISDIQPLFITEVLILLYKVLTQIINDSLNPKCVKVVKINVHSCESNAFLKSTDYCPFNIIRFSKINNVLYLSMIEANEPVFNISSLVIIYDFF
jgi:hypothetical protein